MKETLSWFFPIKFAGHLCHISYLLTLTAIFAAGFFFGRPVTAAAEVAPFFAVVRVAPCVEYLENNAAIELFYRVGGDPTLINAPIKDKRTLSNGAGILLHVHLPRTFGAIPLHLHTVCTNGKGQSVASNTISVSNCTFLSYEDHDKDGLPSNLEDTNCNNVFDAGDYSNFQHADTDGDGVHDLAEFMDRTNPRHPGDSSRPFIYLGGPFDPNGNGNSNPVVWRPSNGNWYIRDFYGPEAHLAIQFGLPGDTPFAYRNSGGTSNVGVIRQTHHGFLWLFNSPGLQMDDATLVTAQHFGQVGDHLIPGPWDRADAINPAIARLTNGQWWFYLQRRNGSVTVYPWGRTGDFPMVQDYDGDGIFDIAVYRPSEETVYVVRSSDSHGAVYSFGAANSDLTVRGDYTGDGRDDISFWDPAYGMFLSAAVRDFSSDGFEYYPGRIRSLQLGLYFAHLPLNWNRQFGKMLYTVAEHATGLRYTRANNDPEAPPVAVQWGLPGDILG